MSTVARIEELRKKLDENPRRYFAPLANELRKAGELTQAIALCREHLPKQPGHMSGHIVFGQALFEIGALDEARGVFEQALALDPENLIALHHLGHTARQQGDAAAARRWYERALETHPRSDDIANQLATLASPDRSRPAIPAPPAVDRERESAFLALDALVPRLDLGAIPTAPDVQPTIGFAAAPPMKPVSSEPIDFILDEPVDGDATAGAMIAATVHVVPATGETSADMSAPALGDDPFGFADDASVSAPSADAAAAAPDDLDAAFEEELVTAGWPAPRDLEAVSSPRAVVPLSVQVTPDAVAAFGRKADDPVDPSHPTAGLDVLGDEADLTPLTPGTPVPAIVESEAVTPEADAAEAAGEPVAQAPAFVTATMGELLVAQGFVDRAVVVYEELVRRRPSDPVLSARLAELRNHLETNATGQVHTARERFAALAARRVVPRATVRPYSPVAPNESLSMPSGPGSRAQDEVAAQALAKAFSPLPKAAAPTPVAGPPVPLASTDAGAGFSFDRFVPDPSAPSSARITAASEAAPQMPAAGGASAGDDLAQFSAWLKGLGQP